MAEDQENEDVQEDDTLNASDFWWQRWNAFVWWVVLWAVIMTINFILYYNGYWG